MKIGRRQPLNKAATKGTKTGKKRTKTQRVKEKHVSQEGKQKSERKHETAKVNNCELSEGRSCKIRRLSWIRRSNEWSVLLMISKFPRNTSWPDLEIWSPMAEGLLFIF